MNINFLFSIIFVGLLAIFFLFEPLNVKQQKFNDIPLFELNKFTLYELDRKGLSTLMNGAEAIKYKERYEVISINYTDNAKKYIANMQADWGSYLKDTITLDGNIVYIREDGLTFKTQKATYNKKTNMALTNTPYTAFSGANIVKGSSLKYNNTLNKIESKNVDAKYILGDKI